MAEYVETLLAPGETIVTNARQHWMALVRLFARHPHRRGIRRCVGASSSW